MGWRQRREITSKEVFTVMMLCSVVLLFLPGKITELGDRCLWLFLGSISEGGRYLTQGLGQELSVTESVPVEEHRQAEIEIYNLRQQLQQTQELNRQLSGLGEQFGRAPVRLIDAQVTGSDTASWRDILLLNHRLKPGQIVLGGIGKMPSSPDQITQNIDDLKIMCVVGQIKDDASDTFRLQLLTDADFSLPIYIEPRWDRREQWRAPGHLNGQGMGQMEAIMVQAVYPIQPGDAVLACSDPQRLPVEMLVGFVKSCRRDPDSPVFWQISVAPAVDLQMLRQVFVVETQWGNPK